MDIYEYMKIKYDTIPEEIKEKYNLAELQNNGHIYIEIQKGMYGLKKLGVLANKNLEKLLEKDGYIKTTFTPGLWKHKSRPIMFNLCVDDFGIKYVGREHANHLIASLEKHYETLTIDWEGKKYCGMDITWNYDQMHCDKALLGYVMKQLEKFKHKTKKRKQHAPSKFTPPQYGQKLQTAKQEPEHNMLSEQEIKKLQRVIGTVLWYNRITNSNNATCIKLTFISTIKRNNRNQRSNGTLPKLLRHSSRCNSQIPCQ